MYQDQLAVKDVEVHAMRSEIRELLALEMFGEGCEKKLENP